MHNRCKDSGRERTILSYMGAWTHRTLRLMLAATLVAGLAVLTCGCISAMGGKAARRAGTRTERPLPPPADWVQLVEFPEGAQRPAPRREADIVAAVEDLGSDDFGHRTRGSRALLAYGEAAIPYLGNRVASVQAGPDPGCAHCIVVHAIVTTLPPARVGVHLDSPYPIVRIAAAVAAGERGQKELAPAIAARLDDPELEVRRASVTALRRITRKFLGYRASDPAFKRADAIAAWRRETGAAPR